MITTAQLLTWMLTSSVVAALLTNVPKWISDWRSGKAAKETHALYAVIVLEEFVSYCSNVVWDMSGGMVGSAGDFGKQHSELPPIANLRSEIDLKALPLDIRSKTLKLYTRINLDNANIQVEMRLTDSYRTHHYAAERGLEAAKIVIAIRERFHLKRERDEFYDGALANLTQHVQTVAEQQRRTQEAFSRAMETLVTDRVL